MILDMAPRRTLPLVSCLFALTANASVEPAHIQSHGMFVEGQTVWAAIEHPKGTSRWCTVGHQVGEFKVLEIRYAQAEVVVTNTRTKEVVTIPVQGLPPQPEKATVSALIPVEQLDWAWIRSDQNFMRDKPESPPHSAIVAWQTASEEFKIALRNFYRKHGWELTRMELRADGRAHVSISPLRDPSIPLPTKEELDRVKVRAGSRSMVNPPKRDTPPDQ